MRTSIKTCFRCGAEKPLADFYRHPQMADGHLNKCKECAKSDVRKHRADNDSVRAYDRKRGNRLPQGYSKQYRERFPEKAIARSAVNNAIRDGRLKKGGECEKCGEKDRIHGHHDDYSKPLDVRWLCARCHQIHHASERRTA